VLAQLGYNVEARGLFVPPGAESLAATDVDGQCLRNLAVLVPVWMWEALNQVMGLDRITKFMPAS
jgi:hypothetical protein